MHDGRVWSLQIRCPREECEGSCITLSGAVLRGLPRLINPAMDMYAQRILFMIHMVFVVLLGLRACPHLGIGTACDHWDDIAGIA